MFRYIIGSVPVFPVLGNHDARKGNGTTFLENFHPVDNPRGTSEEFANQEVLLHQKAGRAFIVRKLRCKRRGE